MIDPNKVQGQRRSSMKTKNSFPEGMTLEQFVAMQAANKKNLKWDTTVTDLEGHTEALKNDTQVSKDKYNEAKTHFVDLVNFC